MCLMYIDNTYLYCVVEILWWFCLLLLVFPSVLSTIRDYDFQVERQVGPLKYIVSLEQNLSYHVWRIKNQKKL